MQNTLGQEKYNEYIEAMNIPQEDAFSQESNYKVAIRNYTSRRYIDINVDLRNEQDDIKHVNAVTILSEALEYFEPYSESFVIRWSNLSVELLQQIGEIGSIIFESGFTSCSANPDYPMEGKEYKLIIEHYNGVFIGEYSEYPLEEEVLIPASSYFIVEDFDEAEKTVVLRQLEPNAKELDEFDVGEQI